MNQLETFEYFISEKNGFIVASLIGSVHGIERFVQMSDDILKAEFNHLILNFRDVLVVSNELIPLFAQLQKQARDKEANLRICGLKPEIRDKLKNAGVVRAHELADNLATALQSIVAQPSVRRTA